MPITFTAPTIELSGTGKLPSSIAYATALRLASLFCLALCWVMKMIGALHVCYDFIIMTLVFLNRAEEGLSICGGSVTPAIISCTTTTSNGFLLWRNSSGLVFSFDDTAIIGANGTLGSTRMTLTNIKTVSNAMVYTSTASENMIQNTTIQCSDGEAPQSIDITLKSMHKYCL